MSQPIYKEYIRAKIITNGMWYTGCSKSVGMGTFVLHIMKKCFLSRSYSNKPPFKMFQPILLRTTCYIQDVQ